MKYSYLLLIVCVFFFGCEPIVKEGEVPRETFTLAKLYAEVRRLDTASEILDFKPDTTFVDYTKYMLEEFFPDAVTGIKGNALSIVESELTPGERGKLTEDYKNEYFFENGQPVKIVCNKSSDPFVKMMKYDASGLMIENKTVYEENDSLVLEYQYDAQKQLQKIQHFDVLNKLIKTTHFFYHKNGNLDSMFCNDTEGEDYSYKYFTNSKSKSYLYVVIDDKGSITSATYYRLNEHNEPIYDEQLTKEHGAIMTSDKYDYTPYGEVKQIENVNKRGQLSNTYTLKQTYPKRDSAGSWVEMFTYIQGNLVNVTRRSIRY